MKSSQKCLQEMQIVKKKKGFLEAGAEPSSKLLIEELWLVKSFSFRASLFCIFKLAKEIRVTFAQTSKNVSQQDFKIVRGFVLLEPKSVCIEFALLFSVLLPQILTPTLPPLLNYTNISHLLSLSCLPMGSYSALVTS